MTSSKQAIRRLDRFWFRAYRVTGLYLFLPLCATAFFFDAVTWVPVFLSFMLTGFCVTRAAKWRLARIDDIIDRFS